MKRPGISSQFLTLLLFLVASGCPVVSSGSTLFPDLDFIALTNGPDLNNGYANVVHVDSKGNFSLEPINFLKGETPYAWDAKSLDQMVLSYRVGGSQHKCGIKYYKDKVLTKDFPLDNNAVGWIVLIPEKDCAVFEVSGNDPHMHRFGRINLTTGEQKFSTSHPENNGFPDIGVRCNPIWDKAKGDLIVVLEDTKPGVNNGMLFYSLARLDPDDLTIKDVVPLGNAKIDTLLFADNSGENVTTYGMIGGQPNFMSGDGPEGFIEFEMNTGKPTMIMKDTKPGGAGPIGIAAIDHRYVILTKGARTWVELPYADHCYCVDLKTQSWQTFPGTGIISLLRSKGKSLFVEPISHEGLQMPGQPANPSIIPARSN